MDITQIDAASFATRTAQVATAELFGLLTDEGDTPSPVVNWFNLSMTIPPRDFNLDQAKNEALAAVGRLVERLGGYVCSHQVDQGERLYRWGVMERIVPPGEWSLQPFELRQAFETFADTCRNTFLAISVAQLAIEEARAVAGVVPTGLKREDSIFADDLDTIGTLRPEAIAAGPLMARYDRERAGEQARLKQASLDRDRGFEAGKRREPVSAADANIEAFNLGWAEGAKAADEADRQKFNGADPAAFDHDGDKKPGGSRKKPKPAPQSIGEAPVRPPVNRGGRGRKKPPAMS